MARGRHRRRRRGAALRALLGGTALALTGAATVISVSQATDDTPGGLERLPAAAGPALHEEAVPWRRLDTLAERLGQPVALGTVLREAGHEMSAEAGCADDGTLPADPEAVRAYCWEKTDARDEDWTPVSVTTSADADDDGRWGEHRVVLSAWTRAPEADGPGSARVAFVDAGDPGRLTYTWGLLALPAAQGERGRGEAYRPLGAEVRGMVWYQDKLLATVGRPDGGETLHVFSLDRVHRTAATAQEAGNRTPFVLPAVASYRLEGGGCGPAQESEEGAACLGALSLDRSTAPDTLVVAERRAEGPSRLWRYTFSRYPGREGLLSVDGGGVARPVESFRTEAAEIRGLVPYRAPGAAEDRWYLASDPREADGGRSALWAQSAGERTARAARCGEYELPFCWAAGARGLALRPGTGELWGVSDAPGRGERSLFTVPLGAVDASLE
ncbi:hypothetical protein [Streptomyces sp. MJP52]|uniref:hypothetical protein n=1 Tax=Streptomyces sp. MJP52 TaxID=2940555 RepID=UPI00140E6031|nr:hypothetical protein [Streptomyces sp. MJP52]MDH6224044.1 hypothetical protein [Streptomyces sp. MJP52]